MDEIITSQTVTPGKFLVLLMWENNKILIFCLHATVVIEKENGNFHKVLRIDNFYLGTFIQPSKRENAQLRYCFSQKQQ